MPSKHKNAATFLRSGFFEGVKSFRDFEERTNKLTNTTEVGDAFEILVEAYLYNDKVLNAKNVWLVGDIPLKVRTELNLPSDSTGIDGVYEDASGKIIPYQVKYRTNTDTLPFGDVSPFLGITEKSLQDRVIFTNARNLADKIINRKGIRSVRAAQFRNLTENDFQDIFAWLSGKKTESKRWLPLPHQKEAIEKITAELKQANRTTAVMACGTGKTLVALWAAEDQKPKTVLVLVPSLALLSQTLPDWCKQTSWGDSFRYLCVCSDASVDRSAKNDEYALRQSDLEFSVTTDAKQVQTFLSNNQSGVNVIFSTYQSAEVVAAGLKGESVDFAIFDEAHKTTGPKEGLFAFGLNDKNITIKKRLFLTATPRHYDLRKRDKNGDFRTVSMDDVEVYGKVSYRLSFSAAVAASIIVPYKVIISLSLNKDVDDELLRRGSTLVRRNQIPAQLVANQIALKRAIKRTSASKIITFHSRISLAKEFAGDDPRGFSEHVKGFDVFHVNSEQNAAERKALLEGFKNAPKSLITNARCLTEGVDVPAVDMVAFIDPRKSRIDIAQAAGRTMRKSKDKKLGYIVVPLFIEQKKGETEEAALARSGFDEVAMVLGAMQENDEDLKDVISEMQQARGRGDKFNPKLLHDKVEVIGPEIDLDKLKHSIDIEIVDRLGVSWDRWYGLLQKFHKREGHCDVPQAHYENGFRLGSWVGTLRIKRKKNRVTLEQIKRLEALGFIWDAATERTERAFVALEKFRKREGHCGVPITHIESGFALGIWVSTRRMMKERLTTEQIKRLNSLGFIWDSLAEQWEQGFEVLQKFHKREGHCDVPQAHYENGFSLGRWANAQRQRRKNEQMNSEQIKRIDALGFSWNPLMDKWEQGFDALVRFQKREGHCRVPGTHSEDGFALGVWVRTRRSRKERLTTEQIKRLNSLGFIWDSLAEQWEEGFAALQKFHKREGHCHVPQLHTENNYRLGIWVNKQRQKRKTNELSRNCIKRLNDLNFAWNPSKEKSDFGFAALIKFKKREGHCCVPQNHFEGNFNLGVWVAGKRTRKNRKNKNLVTLDEIRQLDKLGFVWDTKNDKWEEGFAALKRFYKREGHCRVIIGYSEFNYSLGNWVDAQRQKRKRSQLTEDQIKRLDDLGFIWNPLFEQWEEGFAALQKFHKREGHCRIPAKYIENGYRLGSWVRSQRLRKEEKTLSTDQTRRLDSLDFIWDPFNEQWEKKFTALLNLYKREGHCRVYQSHMENGIKLGVWVNTQRKKYRQGNLTSEQIKRLNDIGFKWRL